MAFTPQPAPKYKGGTHLCHYFGKYGPSTPAPRVLKHPSSPLQFWHYFYNTGAINVSMYVCKYNIFPLT